ncbi:hypothetical protein NBRC116583_18890 [Arenicella sp. 4NH20-0111]|uniref:carboxypeptidase-like regulatory domain-containing protein n=1 Tax=Arenicella sp. 4NH20-0111 TaxID=3127648 RepID=UPI003103BE1A
MSHGFIKAVSSSFFCVLVLSTVTVSLSSFAKGKSVTTNEECNSFNSSQPAKAAQPPKANERSVEGGSPACSEFNTGSNTQNQQRQANDLKATASEAVPDVAFITGSIVSTSNAPISAAIVTALDTTGLSEPMTMSTDSNGVFNLALEPNRAYSIKIAHPDYGKQVIAAVTPDADMSTPLNRITMLERGNESSVAYDGPVTLEAKDGAKVVLDKSNFVDTDGQPFAGDMKVSVTPIDVSNARLVDAFPGTTLGLVQGSVVPELVISLGATEFNFTHDGDRVNLASGATAEIEIPLYVSNYPDGRAIEVGHQIAVSSMDESSGVWKQEGVGSVVRASESPSGFSLRATVTHFSWWSADVAMSTPPGDSTPNTGVAYMEVTINAPQGVTGSAVVEATAQNLVNWQGSTVSIAVDFGQTTASLPIPANREVCVVVYLYYDSGTSGLTNELCLNEVSEATAYLFVTLGEEGPIDAAAQPQTGDDTAFIQGYVGIQTPPLIVAPVTIETTVNYSIVSGTLPNGLSFDFANNVATLVGTPTTAGEQTFIIRATDGDLNFDDITITYNVSSMSPAPMIADDQDLFFTDTLTAPGETIQVNLSDLITNVGGPVDFWIEVDDSAEQTECRNRYETLGGKSPSFDLRLPDSVSLNSLSGSLTFTAPGYWAGCLGAVNENGMSIFLFSFEVFDAAAQSG